MISFNDNWISRHFSSFHLNPEATKVLFNGIDLDLFSTKTKEGYDIKLHLDEARVVLSYLTVFDIYRLSRVNKRFQACIHQVIRPILQRASCMDFSNISLTQMMTYSLQESKINSFILRMFGRALVEAPFLGHFEDVCAIPSHDGEHAVARGLVTHEDRFSRDRYFTAPFISFYVGKREGLGSFKTSTFQQYEGQRWRVDSRVQALRFLYIGRGEGFPLIDSFEIEEHNIENYKKDYHGREFYNRMNGEDREIIDLMYSTPQRVSQWSMQAFYLIFEIFEGKHPRYVLFDSKFPIHESISIELANQE